MLKLASDILPLCMWVVNYGVYREGIPHPVILMSLSDYSLGVSSVTHCVHCSYVMVWQLGVNGIACLNAMPYLSVTGQIAMKFNVSIHNLQRIDPNFIGDTMIFLLEPQSSQNSHFT